MMNETGLTHYQAKSIAYELTRRCASDSVDKLVPVLADARVDLNPHQIEAALFAFRNQFSKGAILADEAGLGKTIEAGLLLSRKWAERKRRLLVILPANLRKQWSQELAGKFFLPTIILENRNFNEMIRAGNLNPFLHSSIILCSCQFARMKEPYIRQTPWDLVVIDEAHRLRNVYKPSSKIAKAIKDSVIPYPKVLLTATPLQNSLLELSLLTVESLDQEEFLILAAQSDSGTVLDEEMCRKLLTLPAQITADRPGQALDQVKIRDAEVANRLRQIEIRNARFFDEEVLKLDRWSDDLKHGLEQEIKELDLQIREARRAMSLASSLQGKLEAQKALKAIEVTRNHKRRDLYDAQDAIDNQRNDLIGRIEKQLNHQISLKYAFSIRWELV